MLNAEGINTISYKDLKAMKRDHQRSGITDFGGVSSAIDRALQESDKRPDPYVMEGLGDILDYVAENIERRAQELEIKHRTAEEWRQLEYEHVIKSDYTSEDLQDDVLTQLEAETITQEQADKVIGSYKECKYRFCIHVFEPNHKSSVYCSSTCREGEKYANREYVRTSKLYANGTYLPVGAYKDIRDDEEKKSYRKHERLFEPETLYLMARDYEDDNHDVHPVNTTTLQNKERRDRASMVDKTMKSADAKQESEVVSYNMNDLTYDELKERGLLKYFTNKRCNGGIHRE